MGSWVWGSACAAAFVLGVWLLLLRLGRKACLAVDDLRNRVAFWAKARGWVMADDLAGSRLPLLARADWVPVAVRATLAGRRCTVLYCQAAEASPYLVCALHLPTVPGQLLVRRRRTLWQLREPAFDRLFSVRASTAASAMLLAPPVRSALARLTVLTRFRELRIVGDLLLVEVGDWVLDDRLDAVVDAASAVAATVRDGRRVPVPRK